MARLSAAQRKAAPHAGPGNSYPIPDLKHARLAVELAGGKSVQAQVDRNVHKHYPEISISGSVSTSHSSRG